MNVTSIPPETPTIRIELTMEEAEILEHIVAAAADNRERCRGEAFSKQLREKLAEVRGHRQDIIAFVEGYYLTSHWDKRWPL